MEFEDPINIALRESMASFAEEERKRQEEARLAELAKKAKSEEKKEREVKSDHAAQELERNQLEFALKESMKTASAPVPHIRRPPPPRHDTIREETLMRMLEKESDEKMRLEREVKELDENQVALLTKVTEEKARADRAEARVAELERLLRGVYRSREIYQALPHSHPPPPPPSSSALPFTSSLFNVSSSGDF